jgi:hypothetical protein
VKIRYSFWKKTRNLGYCWVISDDLNHVIEPLDKVILLCNERKTGQTVMELDSVLLVVSGVHHRDRTIWSRIHHDFTDYSTFLKSLIFFSTAIMSSDGALHFATCL